MQSIIHKVVSASEKFPERNAIFARGAHYSYKRLMEISAGIQESTLKRGYGDEPLMGVLIGDDVFTYASILAILVSGAAYVPINTSNPGDRNLSIIQEAGLKIVLASREHEPLTSAMDSLGSKVEMIPTRDAPCSSGELKLSKIQEGDLAYLFFTSGSTGKPKGVPITHGNLNCFLVTCLIKTTMLFPKKIDLYRCLISALISLSCLSLPPSAWAPAAAWSLKRALPS